MNFLAHGSVRAVRLGGVTGGLSCALLGGIVTLVRAGDGPQGNPAVPAGQATRTSRFMDRFLHRVSTGAESNAPSSTDLQKAAEAASVRYVGTPVPGSRITLRVEGEPDPRTTYRWVQIEGPPVAISDPTRSAIEFSVPQGAADRVRGNQGRAWSTENQPCHRPDWDGSGAGRQDADAAAGRRWR